MFENKNTINCKIIMPAKAFRINSEKDFEGFDLLCSNEEHVCEHRNSGGYCTTQNLCKHKQRKGYIKPCSACKIYPEIGYYVLFSAKGEIIFATEEQVKSNVIFDNEVV
jgi:hypothetical protein